MEIENLKTLHAAPYGYIMLQETVSALVSNDDDGSRNDVK